MKWFLIFGLLVHGLLKTKADTWNGNELYVGNLSLCANVADAVFLPYVGDCHKYYACWSGEALVRQCNLPYVFDARAQSCVNESAAKCLPTCEEYELTTFNYDRTCTKYVLCYYGRPVLRECVDGLQYNAQTDRCDFSEVVDCVDSQCSIYSNAVNLHFVPSKVSCDKYFICGQGLPVEQTCAKGLYFSTKCNCCDLPENSDCAIADLERKVTAFKHSAPRTSDLLCPPDGIHFLAHQNRRDSYYFCVDGHGVTLECTPGLWYDPKVQECRKPYK